MTNNFILTKEIFNSLDISDDIKFNFLKEVKLPIMYGDFLLLDEQYVSLIDGKLVKKYKKYELCTKDNLLNCIHDYIISYLDIHYGYDINDIETLLDMKISFFIGSSDILTTYVARYINNQYYFFKFDADDMYVTYNDIKNILPEITDEEKFNITTYNLLKFT